MKNNTFCFVYTSFASLSFETLQIATLLALRALTHGITQAGRWVLLLQLTVHLHNLLVPVRCTLGSLAGLLASLLLALFTRLSSLLLLLFTRLSSLLFTTR